MKPFFFFFFLLIGAHLSAQNLQIDENKALISFVFLDDAVDGTIGDFKFTGNLNLGDLSNSEMSGNVAMETLDTNNWLRNRHLRAKKYFNVKSHPRLSFSSTSINVMGEGLQVRGNLTIKGATIPVTFFFKRSTTELRGTTSINASDFDIYVHKKSERNKVEITIILPYSLN